MSKNTKNAFSFIELIVVVSILIILAWIWFSVNQKYSEKTTNSIINSNLVTIENSMMSYKQEQWWLPNPTWNIKYYTSSWTYAHDEDEAFWLNGFITEDTMLKKYFSTIPIDPITKNYYAFWKTVISDSFEIAWVLTNNWIQESIVKWNYKWNDKLYNLVREYNWPWYVYDKSLTKFPYNPNDILIKWKVFSYKWNVKINWTNLNSSNYMNYIISEWDNVIATAWSEVVIYISDWSIITLWDSSISTELNFAELKNVENNNLYTNIKLVLNIWSVLVEAAELGEKSNFDIYTSDTEASVRWTIILMSRLYNDKNKYFYTDLSIVEWLVAVSKLDTALTYASIVNSIKNNIAVQTSSITNVDIESNSNPEPAIPTFEDNIFWVEPQWVYEIETSSWEVETVLSLWNQVELKHWKKLKIKWVTIDSSKFKKYQWNTKFKNKVTNKTKKKIKKNKKHKDVRKS
jgi:type II secretory pathway pseudopilin PulG